MSATTPPAAEHAPGDLRIRGAPLAAYYWLLQSGILGFVHFTPLRSIQVEKGVKLNERTARMAIRTLIACGYLEEARRERPNDPARVRIAWESGSPLPTSSRSTVARRVG